MRPRFFADADLKLSILAGVKRSEPGVDFQSAQDAAVEGLGDQEVLGIATRAGRILISHDYGTMPRHFRSFISEHPSPGVFLISQELPIGLAVEALLLVWAASDASEWEGQLTYLPL